MTTRGRLLATPVAAGLVVWALAGILPSVPTLPAGTLVARFGGPSEAAARIRRVTDTFFTGFTRFAEVLGLRRNTRLIEATGPFACDPNEIWRVEIVITQGDAVAKGHTQGFCSGNVGTWKVLAVARGPQAFGSGPAEGCGKLTTHAGSEITDSFEWCGEFVLEPAE